MVQLQSRYNEMLYIYLKEVAEGQKFSEERKPYFSEGICMLHNRQDTYIRELHNK
jgi:hypothetical protein